MATTAPADARIFTTGEISSLRGRSVSRLSSAGIQRKVAAFVSERPTAHRPWCVLAAFAMLGLAMAVSLSIFIPLTVAFMVAAIWRREDFVRGAAYTAAGATALGMLLMVIAAVVQVLLS